MKVKIDAPIKEKLTLEAVKAHLRILPNDTTEDEHILTPLIAAAREYVENITGQLFGERIVTVLSDFVTEIPLKKPPVVSIETVKYFDENDNEHEITAYEFVNDILFLPEPPLALRAVDPIEIIYKTGLVDLPYTIRQAMLLLIGHWYENREAVVVGAVASTEISLSVDRLCKQHKVWWF